MDEGSSELRDTRRWDELKKTRSTPTRNHYSERDDRVGDNTISKVRDDEYHDDVKRGYFGDRSRNSGREYQDYDEHNRRNTGIANPHNYSRNPIKAAKGFHGVVRKPTRFLAGESGAERVDISPMHKEINRHHSRMQEHGWTGVLGAGKHIGRGIASGGLTKSNGSGGILGNYGGFGGKKKSSFW